VSRVGWRWDGSGKADGGSAQIDGLGDVEIESGARRNPDVERVLVEPLQKALRVKLSSGLQPRGKALSIPPLLSCVAPPSGDMSVVVSGNAPAPAEIIAARIALASAYLSDFTMNPRSPAEPSDSAQESEFFGA
jgi:hypothetical protein